MNMMEFVEGTGKVFRRDSLVLKTAFFVSFFWLGIGSFPLGGSIV